MKILDSNLWVFGTLRTNDRAVDVLEEIERGDTSSAILTRREVLLHRFLMYVHAAGFDRHDHAKRECTKVFATATSIRWHE